ncbi:MAG: PQQ-binding-like beta-propeller repeat protein [Acidimicrobiales bacterium]
MTPRARRALASVVVMAGVLVACSSDAPEGSTPVKGSTTVERTVADPRSALVLTGGARFEIPPHQPGKCSFDYRSQISLVNSAGEPLWTRDIPWVRRQGLLRSGPTAVAGTHGGLVAFDAASGAPLWQTSGVGEEAFGINQALVLSSTSSEIRTRSITDGTMAWSWSASQDAYFAGAALQSAGSGAGVVALNDAGTVVGLDAGSGEVLWRVASGGDAGFPPSVSADGQTILQAVFEGRVLALAADGTQRWHWQAPKGAAVAGPPLAHGELVLVRTDPWYGPQGTDQPDPDAAQLVVLRASDGRQLWRTPIDFPAGTESYNMSDTRDVLFEGGMVLIRHPSMRLEAREALTGDVLWRHEAVAAPASRVHLAAIGSVLVVVPRWHEGAIDAFELATGAALWSSPAAGVSFGPPVGLADRLLVGSATTTGYGGAEATEEGRLSAIDPASGQEAWSLQFRDGVLIAPTPSEHGALVISSDPAVFCD